MGLNLTSRLAKLVTNWLNAEPKASADSVVLLNFERLSHEIRPCDVLLVEGRSKVSEVIKLITQSPWTHAALYIGRLYEIQNTELRDKIKQFGDVDPETPLLIETLLGHGTVIYPLSKYKDEHIRICRPSGLSPRDAQKVIGYAINRLGTGYDVRQLLDLARFMFPYGYLPRRWRSSLFSHKAGDPTRTVCSTMLAQAFNSVQFPLLPFTEHINSKKIHFYQRNPKLVTPRDFDFSPYFEIIKYPLFGLDDIGIYRHLPWGDTDIVCNDIDDCFKELPQHALQVADFDSAPQPKVKQELNLLDAVKSARGEPP